MSHLDEPSDAVVKTANGPHLVVVRSAEAGAQTGGAARDRTTSSLAAQTWHDWSFVAGPLPTADQDVQLAGLSLLPVDVIVPTDALEPLVVVLPEGATLAPDALTQIAAASVGQSLVSWDCDIDGEPALRFGWSPETLWSADYLNGCFALPLQVYRAAADSVSEAGLPLCTWSLLLQLPTELPANVHLSSSLVQRTAPGPVNDAVGERLVQEQLDRRGVAASCRRVDGVTHLDWHPEEWPTVTLIVPTRHNQALMDPLLQSLRTSAQLVDGPRFDLLVVDNGGQTPEHESFYDRDWSEEYGFALDVMWWTETPFHYGHVNNAAASRTGSDVIVLLNDDTLVEKPEWLAELVGLVSVPGIGCAGMALLDPEGLLQHAGVWLGLGGYAGHLFAGMHPGDDSIMGSTTWYRNVLAVTAACLAVRRDAYLAVGGLNDRMVLCGSDVTLGLDLVSAGLRNVCSPHPLMHHLESATRSSAPVGDQLVSLELYAQWHDAGDPYLNRRLSLRSKRPRIRKASEKDPVAEARTQHGVTA